MRWRRSADEQQATDADGAAPADSGTTSGERRPKGYTPPKARPTPRRDEVAPPVRPRGPIPPPPQTRREAYRRLRSESKGGRAEIRRRMAAGDESVMGKRDRGPARRLTRDLVDSRRSALTLFLPVFGAYAVAPFLPGAVQRYLLAAVLAAFLLMVADAVQLGRLISRTVPERVPDTTDKPRSLVLYGVLRATLPRRLRLPNPQVRVGETV